MSGSHWSKEELEFLMEYWGNRSIDFICKGLSGRTFGAIKAKASRIMGGAYSMGNFYTKNEVCKVMGVSWHVVSRWCRSGLKSSTKGLASKGVSKPVYIIYEADLIQYLEENQDDWDSTKLEAYALGIEPDWLKEKRFRDAEINISSTSRLWSPDEVSRLKALYGMGYSSEKIAALVGRKVYSVRGKISRMQRDGELEKRRVHIPFTLFEDGILEEMLGSGRTVEQISEALGRPIGSVNARIRSLKLKRREEKC